MKRFISAMPSSICWPLGENSQLNVDGMRSLLKMSAIASRANRPRRFTQGPRLVETVTSGDVVTMRRAKSLSPRPISLSNAPKPLCVAIVGWTVTAKLSGTSITGALSRRSLPARERHAGEKALQFLRRQREALEFVPFVAGPHRHCLAERLHLRRRHQSGVIVLVAGHRQAEAFDCVSK